MVAIDLDHPDFSNQKKFDNWVSKVGITFFFLLPKNGITQDTNLVIPISSLKEQQVSKNISNKHGLKYSNTIFLVIRKCMLYVYRTSILMIFQCKVLFTGKQSILAHTVNYETHSSDKVPDFRLQTGSITLYKHFLKMTSKNWFTNSVRPYSLLLSDN